MNIIETLGAIAAGIITVAIVALVVAPQSSASRLATASGNAFATTIKAATLRG